MNRIFVVEDDAVIAREMKKHLTLWGYQVELVVDFKNVMEEALAFQPHLILMDISLPYYNGYYWCESIRRQSTVPIIFVSSASDNMNIVMAVNMGGDDFIAKPFDFGVLTAKVQAMLRRSYAFREELSILERNGLTLDLSSTMAEYKNEKIDLTKNEYRILRVLMEHPGQVVSREDIMTALWEDDSFIDDNTLTVNMTRLRKKLEGCGLAHFIQTKKGMGYFIL